MITVPIVVASFWDLGWIVFFLFNGTLFLVSLIDLWLLPKRDQLSCSRQINEELEREEKFQVQLHISNSSHSPILFRLVDDLPSSFIQPFPIKGKVKAAQQNSVSYESRASVRGDYALQKVYFRYRSVLGLWEKQMVFPIQHKVRVIPNLSHVKNYLASSQQFLLLQGVKVKKNRIGSGEFAQIRSYVTGDDPRKINWYQSAKLTELMTNVYEPEHGKQITLLLDCGRKMGVELTKGNRLELVLEAALLVAAAALQQGDYVSVLAFSNQMKAYVPPGKGLGHLKTILRQLYHIRHDSIESNYGTAFEYIETVQKRRSFILLFSDLDSILFDETMIFYIQKLYRRHLFLIMSITDPMLLKWGRANPDDTKAAMIKSSAQREMLRRKQDIRRLNQMGITMVQSSEEQLAVETLTRYIEIINQGLL